MIHSFFLYLCGKSNCFPSVTFLSILYIIYPILGAFSVVHEIFWFPAWDYYNYDFVPQFVLQLVCFAVLTGSASVTACCILVCCVNCFPPCLLHILPPILCLHSLPAILYSYLLFTKLYFLNPFSLGAPDSLYLHLSLPNLSFIPHSLPFHSSLNSVNSSDSRGSSGSHSHSPSSSSSSSTSHHLFHHHQPRHRYRSSTLPQQTPARLSSISSHDSGFISSSQDQFTSSKSSSPMPAETKVRKTLSYLRSKCVCMVETRL